MERITKYLNRVTRAAVLDRASAFSNRDLSGMQISFILQICRNPGLTQEQLAKRLFIDKSTVTRNISRMAKNGFIRREVDSADRRARLLFPTRKAKELYPVIIEYLDEWNDYLTGDLNEEDQESLLRLIRHLTEKTTQRIKDKGLATLIEMREV